MTRVCNSSDLDLALEKFLSIRASFSTALADLLDVTDLARLFDRTSRAPALSDDFLRKLERELREVSIPINCSLMSIDLFLAAGRRATGKGTPKATAQNHVETRGREGWSVCDRAPMAVSDLLLVGRKERFGPGTARVQMGVD